MLVNSVRTWCFRRLFFVQTRAMTSQLFFIGQPSQEGPPAILFQHETHRYLFNCREGTQRLCVEDKLKLAKLKAVFLTRNQWECTGGLPGMILTVADAGVKDLSLCGGPNMAHFLASTRQFVFRTGINVQTHEFDDELTTYKDKLLDVTTIRTRSTSAGTKRTHHDASSVSDASLSDHALEDASMPEGDPQQYRQKVLDQMFASRVPQAKGETPEHTIEASCQPRHPLRPNASNKQRSLDYLSKPLPRSRPDHVAVSYICRLPSRRGKFMPDAAKKLGVPPGPMFGKLQRGESITLQDGTVVTHDQVCQPDVPGPVFMVVDCPHQTYIDQLVTSPSFQPYQNNANVKLVVHLTSDEVLASASYRQWMNSFHKDTDHIISSTGYCAQSTMYRSHALSQYKLSKLDDEIFKVPHYKNTPDLSLDQYDDLPPKVRPLQHKSMYTLESRPGRASTLQAAPPVFDVARAAEDDDMVAFDQNQEYQQAIAQARTDASHVHLTTDFAGHDVRVITLGTGSSVPSKYRNVSATLVKIPSYGSILLDAGEGTYGQMLRHFGSARINEELKALKCIFVSHLHADHHLGVIQVLLRRKKIAGTGPLHMVAPAVFRSWLKEYNDIERLGSPSKLPFTQCNHALPRFASTLPNWSQKNLTALCQDLGLQTLEAVEVVHCRWAYGLSIVHKDGWKLVYSGDTRPCQRLIDAGKDATVLIHEATLEDSMKEEAIAKRHSTTEEAVLVGKQMNARYTLLNHFSQRYAKVPSLSEAQANVSFSFDMMSVMISQIPVLPKFTAAMQLIFKEEEDDDVDAAS
ncbi:beta-lactamase-like protein [Gongronella butleri]|nr:beta-lactamase-like protein [Gongronella butleri]